MMNQSKTSCDYNRGLFNRFFDFADIPVTLWLLFLAILVDMSTHYEFRNTSSTLIKPTDHVWTKF